MSESDRRAQHTVVVHFVYVSPRLPAGYHDQVYMNRIAAFTNPNASKHELPRLNSEWVLGQHLRDNNIRVSMRYVFPIWYCHSNVEIIICFLFVQCFEWSTFNLTLNMLVNCESPNKRKKRQFTPNLGKAPEVLHTCSMSPCRPANERCWCRVLFGQIFGWLIFLDIWGARNRNPLPKKTKHPQYCNVFR